MKCPHCGAVVKFAWDGEFERMRAQSGRLENLALNYTVKICHGYCPNCHQFTMLAVYYRRGPGAPGIPAPAPEPVGQEWLIPKFERTRPISADAPPEVRSDFEEAAKLLSISPKASAAISRRLLQHILRDYCGMRRRDLAQEIETYITLPSTPSHIADALDGIRHVGNFAAHPIKYEQSGEVVSVEPGEAEWLLDSLESLVDFVFVQPKRLEQRRNELNEKLRAAGKPEIRLRPSEPDGQ
jgi:hypothetical protein